MTRNNRSGLSHHEELRYDYLLKNLQYLNDREKNEFNYLQQKKDQAQYQQSAYYDSYSSLSAYDGSEHQRDFYAEDYGEADDDYTLQGLPKYPEESSRRARRSASAAQQGDLPVYPDTAGYSPRKPKKRKKKGRLKRILLAAALVLLAVFAGMLFMFIKGMNDISSGKSDYTAAVTETFNGVDTEDGTNILVLGSDQRVTQGSDEARTDTIMVVNVGNSDNKVKMVSFMRDTLVNIEGYSYDDYSYDLKLNSAFNFGEQDNNQGAEYMRRVLKNNFDIDIKYYVMVDFETFAEAIDTLFPKGVKIDAQFGTVDGEEVSSVEVPDDLNMENGVVPNQTIEEGVQRMDGRTLLNYARFRKDDDGDYGRTVRQQQVISAIISQIKDPTKLFTGSAAIGKIYALTSTNISYTFLLTNGLSMLSDAQNGIEQATVPSEGGWIDDFDMYGGQALYVDFESYKQELSDLGLR
ncbi:LytR family transcriptional regulator [Streptococcus chenjunshii]|uniref:Regulatory protein MsrR n=1 Tax=Streptococcus chenjunshii TaxID=2173853 RepID=A0A372KNP0_9STRE|nr:LCP family protein [Streptococcus chenjunshii]AXQ78959.1 LytR family transcriptional regulator [Streptococcus chenjunshii]RFU51386.1 LytR family transcriptional regulator [Streptococcus chenjunshii]RFU53586.1 LytR family transcriptional regulator [Streptococcus chenjunshii]